jgi:hypothetical protein
MKYHILTVAILLCALALYAVGMSGGGSVLLLMGAGLELWSWVRVIHRRQHAALGVPLPKP